MMERWEALFGYILPVPYDNFETTIGIQGQLVDSKIE
uniref:Uncharacterized protein n=1 Tax=Arundo donax TaxID=35708 RepID=A0A0A8Z3L6_ARUDO